MAGLLAERFRLVTYDRVGWGQTTPVGDYTRTSVVEQAILTGGLLRDIGAAGVTVLGVGFGAVVALELALAEPKTIERVMLIEPPLFGLVTSATEGMSSDVDEIRDAAHLGGELAAYELFLAGRLHTLGCGAGRLGESAARGQTAAHTFLVELPAVPAWPIDSTRLALLEADSLVATLPSTPPLLADAAERIALRIPGCERVSTLTEGPEAAAELVLRER